MILLVLGVKTVDSGSGKEPLRGEKGVREPGMSVRGPNGYSRGSTMFRKVCIAGWGWGKGSGKGGVKGRRRGKGRVRSVDGVVTMSWYMRMLFQPWAYTLPRSPAAAALKTSFLQHYP